PALPSSTSRRMNAQTLFKTRITDLFGIRLPIIASGLMWLATAEYVGAAVNAGVTGFLTAASFTGEGELRSEIRRCREIAHGTGFGVNFGVRPGETDHDRIMRVIETVIEEHVPFVETFGHNPERYVPILHEARVKIV